MSLQMLCLKREENKMDKLSLAASTYQLSSAFFNYELECVLKECVDIYQYIVQQSVSFTNNEELIRDGFLIYLKDDDYKNAHAPLDKYQFDKEVEDGSGRLDIRILPVNPYQGDKAFYSIECKRIDNKSTSGKSGLNAEYIKNGICRYVNDYYSTYYSVNAMFGFVVEEMDIAENIECINRLLPYDYRNQRGEVVRANFVQKLTHNDFVSGYPYSYISKHNHISGKQIVLYHLMFDFSQNIH